MNEFVVTDLPEFESSLNPGLFRIYIKSQKRHLSLRTNSANECALWLRQIDQAKRNFSDIHRRLTSNETLLKPLFPSQAPFATLFVTIVEALQLYTRNCKLFIQSFILFFYSFMILLFLDALNSYCKISIGKDSSSVHISKRTKTIRQEIHPTSIHSLGRTNHHYKSDLNLNITSTISSHHGSGSGMTFKIIWNNDFRINIGRFDELLFISCFDENPYAPDQCLGEAAIPIKDIVEEHRNVKGSITKDIRLKIPNAQQKLFINHHHGIKPSVLIKYDLLKLGER